METEIKFRIANPSGLEAKLRALGLREQTPRTHEMNLIYDFADLRLRSSGELMRIRRYGEGWLVTHKAKGTAGRHKLREEAETSVQDGETLGNIFEALGMRVVFRYEKFRSEWSDGRGHVVLDETPIGSFGEIEGEAEWIDETAKRLGIAPEQYITKSYAELFTDWKRQTGSAATDMTFAAIGSAG